ENHKHLHMAGDHNHHESPNTVTLQAAVTEIRCLQAQMATIEREKAQNGREHVGQQSKERMKKS
ncbi:hypothetical protein A2U01_0090232, partial [Trifolium medium]|nr:hypothetical protein [Trifolium medium]